MRTIEDVREIQALRTTAERLEESINGKYVAWMIEDFEKLETIRNRLTELGGDATEFFQKLLVKKKEG
jgi:hypothetical protein